MRQWEWGRRGGKGQTGIPDWHPAKSSGPEELGHKAPPEHLAVSQSASWGRWHHDIDTGPSWSRYFCCLGISCELLVAAQLVKAEPMSLHGGFTWHR